MSLIKSESITKLVTALAIAKAAFSPVLKLSENPGFKRNGKISKYADLATAIEATETALLANGLVVSQFPVNDGERVGALTLLTHESGEYLGGAFTLPLGQQNAQTGVAAVTYARRTGYLAALGIASEDDDGNTATGRLETATDDFQKARHAALRVSGAPKAEKATPTPNPAPNAPQEAPTQPQRRQTSPFREVAEATAEPEANVVAAAGRVAAIPEHGDAYEGPDDDGSQPTEEEMAEYRGKFVQLVAELADAKHGENKLSASRGLKLNRKVLTFIQQMEHVKNINDLTKGQWNDFFIRANAAKEDPKIGLIGLRKMIQKANGLDGQ